MAGQKDTGRRRELSGRGRVSRRSVRVPPGLGGGDEGLVPLGDLAETTESLLRSSADTIESSALFSATVPRIRDFDSSLCSPTRPGPEKNSFCFLSLSSVLSALSFRPSTDDLTASSFRPSASILSLDSLIAWRIPARVAALSAFAFASASAQAAAAALATSA